MSMPMLKALLKQATPDLRKIGHALPKLMKHLKLQKLFFKVMTKIWSEDEESRRVLAFLNVLQAVDIAPECMSLCIKTMFAAYVRNSKFVFGGSIAAINFMRLSLLELFSKNLDEAYLHAFVYIRQLAICLRKAHTSHSKEDLQAVQNWQFVNSFQLWSEFVAKYHTSHKLIRSLIHPLVQLLIGTVRLSPGERWIPLRFHCVSLLHTLAGVPTLRHNTDVEKTETDILPLTGNALSPANRLLVPSLSLLLDTFHFVNFNRRATSVSPAPLDLRLLLHFSPSQRKETASLDAVVSWLVDLLTEAAAIQANSVAFPEFVLPLVNELKQFSRTCRVAAFTRQTKALQAKLREHSDWICVQRRRVRSLANLEEIVRLESSLSVLDGSAAMAPFWTFYVCHKEVRAQELARLTESHKKDAIPDETAQPKRKFQSTIGGDSDEDSDSVESDESYDVDDGTSITHVSKSKKRDSLAMDVDRDTGGSATGNADSEDSDFDLEAALKEPEEKSGSEASADEVTDFELSDSECEDERDDEEVLSGTEDDDSAGSPPITSPIKKKTGSKKPSSSRQKTKPKKRQMVQKPAAKVHKKTMPIPKKKPAQKF
ncbi:Nucleolar complex protein 2 [Clonorchis sinensis]|uniref:Nucleolar complex protein 2 n=1 Tax=Clonorchis sinensis TaxID=79923 RepID=A0A8T1LY68_CLOSI|nr:Nucleolar complex protein 2 [Clonorchis sinensis]